MPVVVNPNDPLLTNGEPVTPKIDDPGTVNPTLDNPPAELARVHVVEAQVIDILVPADKVMSAGEAMLALGLPNRWKLVLATYAATVGKDVAKFPALVVTAPVRAGNCAA